DGIRDFHVTGVQTCALPISAHKVFGWSHTCLTDAAREQYAATIARLQAGITVYLESPEAAAAARPKQTGKSRNLLRAVCACAEQIGRASCRDRARRCGRPVT